MKRIIGLTGPSGAGKSTVSKLFAQFGAHTIDADIVARCVVEKGKPALTEIVETFGNEVLLPDGCLNRKQLASIVFTSEESLHKLNGITHKYIQAEIAREIANCTNRFVVVDAAVLFESGMDKMCDVCICVLAEINTRIARIVKRDQLTEQQAKERIYAQNPDHYYTEKSDFVIENNGDNELLQQRVEQIVKKVCCE